jgi:LmbE family N-acetylglucosaminyl deacetylase
MKLHQDQAEIFIPDGLDPASALSRTTHLAVAAHQDDIEIMAAAPVIECYQRHDLWFTGVVITDGRGSPRNGIYKDYDDEQMRRVRFSEQRKAALVGEYAAQIMLDFPSKAVKDPLDVRPVEDLVSLFEAARPRFLFTHNLADKHDTHVAVALRVIEAARRLPVELRPEKCFGCEVWRSLEWLPDVDQVVFDLTRHENLQAALLGVFDSQISGGKRYDLAALGRRRANATFYESHNVDLTSGLSLAMDLTPLIVDPQLEIIPFVERYIQRFSEDITRRLKKSLP